MFVIFLQMEVVPLKEDGKEITENDDIFIENPSNLVSERSFFVYFVPEYFEQNARTHSDSKY